MAESRLSGSVGFALSTKEVAVCEFKRCVGCRTHTVHFYTDSGLLKCSECGSESQFPNAAALPGAD